MAATHDGASTCGHSLAEHAPELHPRVSVWWAFWLAGPQKRRERSAWLRERSTGDKTGAPSNPLACPHCPVCPAAPPPPKARRRDGPNGAGVLSWAPFLITGHRPRRGGNQLPDNEGRAPWRSPLSWPTLGRLIGTSACWGVRLRHGSGRGPNEEAIRFLGAPCWDSVYHRASTLSTEPAKLRHCLAAARGLAPLRISCSARVMLPQFELVLRVSQPKGP